MSCPYAFISVCLTALLPTSPGCFHFKKMGLVSVRWFTNTATYFSGRESLLGRPRFSTSEEILHRIYGIVYLAGQLRTLVNADTIAVKLGDQQASTMDEHAPRTIVQEQTAQLLSAGRE